MMHNHLSQSSTKGLKYLIYSYILLLIFEGALRRWILPSLATPLLIIRDPLVIVCYIIALRDGIFPWNKFVVGSLLLAVFSGISTMLIGHGNLSVTLFGIRANFLHIPMIFLIPKALNYIDVCRVGKFFLLASIPMVVLIAIQFYSAPRSWVNVGVGGIGTATFSGAMGFSRPPGTFSFISGTSSFFVMTSAFLFASFFQGMGVRKWLQALAALCILGSIPFSISRGLLSGVMIVGFGALVAGVVGRGKAKLLVRTIVLVAVAVFTILWLPFLETPREAFLSRWTAASKAEGGVRGIVSGRMVGTSLGAFTSEEDNGFFGRGIGLGTNAADGLLGGKKQFLVEDEWNRVTTESGFMIGLLYIGIRIGIVVFLFLAAWRSLRVGNTLPLTLWFASSMTIALGQWGQPTAQGFGTLGAGLVLAACNLPPKKRLEARPSFTQSTNSGLHNEPQ